MLWCRQMIYSNLGNRVSRRKSDTHHIAFLPHHLPMLPHLPMQEVTAQVAIVTHTQTPVLLQQLLKGNKGRCWKGKEKQNIFYTAGLDWELKWRDYKISNHSQYFLNFSTTLLESKICNEVSGEQFWSSYITACKLSMGWRQSDHLSGSMSLDG